MGVLKVVLVDFKYEYKLLGVFFLRVRVFCVFFMCEKGLGDFIGFERVEVLDVFRKGSVFGFCSFFFF